MNIPEKPTQPKRSKIFFIIGFFLLFFSAIFILVGYNMLAKEGRYKNGSAVVTGTVLNKTAETKHDKEGSSTYYYVSYDFSTKDGEHLQGKSMVSNERWQALEENKPLEVQYLVSDHTVNRVNQESELTTGYVFSGIGALVLLLGFLFIRYEIKTRRKIKFLLQHGLTADATVTAVGPGNLSINDVQQWRIKYSFTDYKGRKVSGRTEHMAPDLASCWHCGEKGKVRYDKQNSQIHMWVGA